MIIEIILYTSASLGAPHQSGDYSVRLRATTRVVFGVCNFRPVFVCLALKPFDQKQDSTKKTEGVWGVVLESLSNPSQSTRPPSTPLQQTLIITK